MTNMAPYNLPQSVFMMNLGSNALFGQKNTQQELQSEITAFLKEPFFSTLNTPSPNYPSLAGGDWGTVWGPVVFQAELNGGATNTMFVAQSPSLNIYVVAIAGTNPTGWTAVFTEDLDVNPSHMKQWPPTVDLTNVPQTLEWTAFSGDPATAAGIDAGTAYGISKLYTMVDPGTNKTLVQFLNAIPQSDQTLVFTGHSLGGALSPTLAMLLYPQAASSPTPSNNDAPNPQGSQWSNVYILASAGPTPGTPGFAAQFFTPAAPPNPPGPSPVTVPQPPPAPPTATGHYAPVATGVAPGDNTWTFSYWNMNYANVYDVVPRAWSGLYNLVVQPKYPLVDKYPSFFAGGATLEPLTAGPETLALMNKMMGRSGYDGNSTTPYYAPCLLQSPFNGTWGNWGDGSYPTTFATTTPPTNLLTIDDVKDWVLNAHLGQYSYALLGYPCPNMSDTASV